MAHRSHPEPKMTHWPPASCWKSVTGTLAAGRPRVVSSTCVVIGLFAAIACEVGIRINEHLTSCAAREPSIHTGLCQKSKTIQFPSRTLNQHHTPQSLRPHTYTYHTTPQHTTLAAHQTTPYQHQRHMHTIARTHTPNVGARSTSAALILFSRTGTDFHHEKKNGD